MVLAFLATLRSDRRTGRRRQLRPLKRFFKNPIDGHDTAAAKDAKQTAIV
jgi:hypothetical protein